MRLLGSFITTGLPGSDLKLRYTYDYADRRIRRMIDADGIAGAGQESVSFAGYAGDICTLEIARTNDKLVIDPVTRKVFGFLGQVVQRNFSGNGVDEILAVDKITWNGTTPTTSTYWTFTDHQDSVREIVLGNTADTGSPISSRRRGGTRIGITGCSRQTTGSGGPSRRSRLGISASNAMPRLAGMRSADIRWASMPREAAATRLATQKPRSPDTSRKSMGEADGSGGGGVSTCVPHRRRRHPAQRRRPVGAGSLRSERFVGSKARMASPA